jgi:cell wall-associated NlpC family hydrolase
MAEARDPRTTPARGDIAAKHLEGIVAAARFVEGVKKQIVQAAAALRRRPAADAMQETQLLFGETFAVYDEAEGWAWGQADLDDYVGYVEARALAAPALEATHRVAALRTIVFSAPDLKTAPLKMLSMNARVRVEAQEDRFARIARGGWVFAPHLAALDTYAPDWVAEAEKFLGAPYLWGGRDSLGLDCSGLVQTALAAAGMPAPRDTDMMERALGRALAFTDDLEGLERGDLVFWKGHMGVMLDGERLLHANAYHMATTIEPLRAAAARIRAVAGPITSIKRL